MSRPPKRYDSIDDVMDSLTRPQIARCRLKVDLLDDVLDVTDYGGVKQPRSNLRDNPITIDATRRSREIYHSPDGHRGHSPGGSRLGQLMSPPGDHLRHNTSTHSSIVDDLLDASTDDPGFVNRRLNTSDDESRLRRHRDMMLDDTTYTQRSRRDCFDSTSTEAILSAIDDDMRELDLDRLAGNIVGDIILFW